VATERDGKGRERVSPDTGSAPARSSAGNRPPNPPSGPSGPPGPPNPDPDNGDGDGDGDGNDHDDDDHDLRGDLANAIAALANSVARPRTQHSKVQEPDQFDGSDSRKLQSFLVQCQLNFNDRVTAFASDKAKVNYVLSFLKGMALD
jgi:hypothetical protein